MTSSGRSVLLVGASRGLGLRLAEKYLKRWHVTATMRGAGRAGLHDLAESAGGRLTVEMMDINEPEQVDSLHGRLAGSWFDLRV